MAAKIREVREIEYTYVLGLVRWPGKLHRAVWTAA